MQPAGMPPAALTPDQLHAMVEASRRARKLRRCCAVATFGAWTTGAFGLLTLLALPLSFSWPTLAIGLGLVAAAVGEFHGRALVRAFDDRGPLRLAYNQAFLGAVLVGYSIWCLIAGHSAAPPPSMLSGDPQIDEMVASLTRTMNIAVYGTLAVVGIIAPGLTAWYYASRAPYLREFRNSTDPSVVEALKAA